MLKERLLLVGDLLTGSRRNLLAIGISVTVVDFADQILPNILDPEMAAYAKKHLLKAGIRVITGTQAKRLWVRIE